MTEGSIIEKARAYLRDPDGAVWSYAELAGMLAEAVKRYSEDSGFFRGSFHFAPDESGVYAFPEDYIFFQTAYDAKGNAIDAISITELQMIYPDYLNVKGEPEYIGDDLDNPGLYRLCPNPVDLQAIGIGIFNQEYGVLLDGYGETMDGDSYGVVSGILQYEFIGDCVYSRYAALSEILDYMALVYHVVSQAYDIASEWGNAKLAAYYKSRYKERIFRFTQVKHNNVGKSVPGKFY